MISKNKTKNALMIFASALVAVMIANTAFAGTCTCKKTKQVSPVNSQADCDAIAQQQKDTCTYSSGTQKPPGQSGGNPKPKKAELCPITGAYQLNPDCKPDHGLIPGISEM